jgi:hypothetical protein
MPKQTKLGENAEIYQPRKKQTEREKLRELPTKKKITYLWEYYRVPAFVVIASVALISYIIYIMVSPKVETKLYAAIIDNTVNEQTLTEYQTAFAKHLNLDPKKEAVNFNSNFYFNGADEVTSRQVLTTYIAAKEVDVIIAPESEFKNFAYYGYLDKLSNSLPTDLYSSMTNRFYISDSQDDKEKNAYGIYLTDSDLFKNNTDNSDPYVLGIVVNSNYKDNAVEFIRYLFHLFP